MNLSKIQCHNLAIQLLCSKLCKKYYKQFTKYLYVACYAKLVCKLVFKMCFSDNRKILQKFAQYCAILQYFSIIAQKTSAILQYFLIIALKYCNNSEKYWLILCCATAVIILAPSACTKDCHRL